METDDECDLVALQERAKSGDHDERMDARVTLRECRQDARVDKAELRELDAEALQEKLDEARENFMDVAHRERAKKKQQLKLLKNQNRAGLWVLLIIVAIMFWFVYHFVLDGNETAFYLLAAVFLIGAFVALSRNFRKSGPMDSKTVL